jgi:hypothetical protein
VTDGAGSHVIDPGAPVPSRVKVRIAGASAGVLLALVPWLLLTTHDPRSHAQAVTPRPLPAAVTSAGLAERSGVRVVRVAETAGGGLLDLRYEVVNPDVAAAIHDTATPPALVDERSGLVIGQLLMGHVHKGQLKAGLSYYLVFLNPGDAVRRGDRVSVVLGHARLQHVRVR